MVVAFARLVRQDLEEALQSLDRALLAGDAKSFEEYRYLTGKRQGLQQALAIIDDTSKRFDEN
jgi:hypothetical protein